MYLSAVPLLLKMNTEERICRLCFKMCGNFTTNDDDFKKVMDILLLRIDIAAIQEPVVCTLCADILLKYFEFKARCSNTHNYIIQFVNKEDGVKLILRCIYMTKNKTSDSVPEDQDVCGLCMTLIKKCFGIFLDADEKILKQCLPELDLSVIKDPVICSDCHASLEKYYLFMTTVSIAEEKLKYMETLDINSKSETELSILLQFIIREKISEINGNGGDIIKLENMVCSDRENAEEEVEHKYNPSVDIELKSNNGQAFTPKNMLDCEIESNEIGALSKKEIFCGENGIEFKQELFVKTEDQEMLCDEEIEIKTDELDSSRFEESIMIQPKANARLKGKQECSLPNFEDSVEVTMYKCYSCTYQTKRKFHLKRHFLKHKTISKVMYKCDSCLYRTSRRDNLNTHLLKHKDISEVTVHKCDSCVFQTISNRCFKRHLLKHMTPSEVTMYKCDSCSYQSTRRDNLNLHLLRHKDASEVTMYKCYSCVFQTKYKRYLKRHLLMHRAPSEVTMYKCDSCSYQTKYNRELKRHMLRHKDPSEVTIYKCDSCLYQTRYKQRFKTHLLKHKAPAEINMYKCDSCSYQSKYRNCLKKHSLMHKNPEIKMYKCDACVYQTINKQSFKKHLLKHKDISEVTMYKCDSCVYQTINKQYFKSHLLKHKDISEVIMYKCDSCSYKTKYKGYLKIHSLKHKDRSEVIMYECDTCLYRTKNKDYLRRHVLRHKNLSK